MLGLSAEFPPESARKPDLLPVLTVKEVAKQLLQ
jgi:hypothetical protein